MRRAPLLGLVATLAATPARGFDPDLLDTLLAEYTTPVADAAGVRVDYAGLAAEPRWPTLLEGLAAAPEPEAHDARMAFWINAYNVLAIDVVRRNRPLESIRDAGSLFRPVWDREAGRAAGRAVSLGTIEHEILRPMGDPRIHAAIVCASTSCPSLRREAFRAEALEAQLEDALRTFLADPRKGARVDPDGEALRLSKIFDWFAEDFEPVGGVRAYLAPRLPDEPRAWLAARGARAPLRWFDYDWRLNAWRRDAAPGARGSTPPMPAGRSRTPAP